MAESGIFYMNNSIIITGANSGIGLELVKQLATESNNLTIIAISRSINQLEQLSYANLKIYQCDISKYEELAGIIAQIASTYLIDSLLCVREHPLMVSLLRLSMKKFSK